MTNCETCGQPVPASEFDDERRDVLWPDGSRHHLQPTPWSMLAVLRKAHGRTVERDAVLQSVWNLNADYPEARGLDVHMVHIRDALVGTRWRVATEHGIGWRLEAREKT